MSIFHISLISAIIVLSFCVLMAMYRFLKGPTLPDRISAFDLVSANLIATIAIYSELTNNKSIMDVALILSLFAFLGAISFAYYLVKK